MNGTTSLRAVGIGDLHFDGKLRKFIPNLNDVIAAEVNVVLAYARRNGIKNIFYYGDICDVPHMSTEATVLLLSIFCDHLDLNHYLITGNHDYEDVNVNSLQVLNHLCTLGKLPNVRIMDSPKTLFREQGTPVRFLPWPHFSVKEDCLNVLHVETNGSSFESGGAIASERDTDYHCVAGHLHGRQTVGPNKNIHFSGTLYQTNFGEHAQKYFHDITWDGASAKVKCVPHVPEYTLVNLIVSSVSDLDKISDNPKTLYKVFVKSGVDINVDTFHTRPNVVKINSFKNRKELNELIAEELILNDASAVVTELSVIDALRKYAQRHEAPEDVTSRALEILSSL